MRVDPTEITRLLGELQAGAPRAEESLLPLVYDQLRTLARQQMARERAGHTLQATVLVHEAFMALVGQQRVDWKSRAHFMSVAALAMRRILINHAKARLADKRGAGAPMATFDEQAIGRALRAEELVALDDALEQLAKQDSRGSDVVTYKFFAGLTYEEIAEVLDVSVPTVRRSWRFARAWLLRELNRADGS